MKIADLYARTPEKTSQDASILRGFYYSHIPELEYALPLPVEAPRMTIHIYKEFDFDCRRFWRLAAVFLDGQPVMVIQNAGREGDDHAARFITDRATYGELVRYLASLMHPDPPGASRGHNGRQRGPARPRQLLRQQPRRLLRTLLRDNMKGLRKIVVPGPEHWTYKVFLSCTLLFDPKGKKYVVPTTHMTGRDWNTLERGQWKKTDDGWVTPRHIAEFIQQLRSGDVVLSGDRAQLRCTRPGCKDAQFDFWAGICYEHCPKCDHEGCQRLQSRDGLCWKHQLATEAVAP